jgi:hypothetical protein
MVAVLRDTEPIAAAALAARIRNAIKTKPITLRNGTLLNTTISTHTISAQAMSRAGQLLQDSDKESSKDSSQQTTLH